MLPQTTCVPSRRAARLLRARQPLPSRAGICMLSAAMATLALTGCKAISAGMDRTPETVDAAGDADAVNVAFLLSMTWAEAKGLSPQSLVIPPYYKLAADEIRVLQRDKAGRAKRVHAKGRVFLQVDFSEKLVSLGQESYIESGGELIMRGKPLLQRGRSLVEGLSDTTVFYIKGTRLQVIGQHRLTKQSGSNGERGSSSSGITGGRADRSAPTFNVQPNWSRSWRDGPNPLLPALSPDDVPEEMRGTPLLPPLEDGDEDRERE